MTQVFMTLLEKKSSFMEVAQFEELSQDLWRGCGANKTRRGYHSAETEDQKGFFPQFVNGLGIYCNGFWGSGPLGPLKCN